ncbi:Neuromedin-B [Heterocephalus glaber]|uniref:Neuromedin-B n=1 Tax=Heterocephalus glaber TaxID=10181 RepID=G5B1S1_HETGA|nr:Neuromedin-B [Heterocephalus glaber]
MVRSTGGTRLLGGFLLWVLLAAGVAPLTWDLQEARSRASKIRVHPRGNLWATGHFMGKKSLEPLSPSLLGTTPHTSPRDQQLQLSHDLLRSLLLRRALGMTLGSPAPHTQEPPGAHAAEETPGTGQGAPLGLDFAHLAKWLNGSPGVVPSRCKSRAPPL